MGGKDKVYYFGAGSHDDQSVERHLEVGLAFLKGHNNGLTVCVFNEANELVPYSEKYMAIDIVKILLV